MYLQFKVSTQGGKEGVRERGREGETNFQSNVGKSIDKATDPHQGEIGLHWQAFSY